MTAREKLLGLALGMLLLGVTGTATLGRHGLAADQHAARVNKVERRAKVDINIAPAAELEKLPGMSRQLSERIIAHRPYQKIDDLVRLKVLGRKQLAAIKESIVVRGGRVEAGPEPSR